MQNIMHLTVFDRIIDGIRDFATTFANARYAAWDLERLHAMSDDELAYRGLAREDITDHVMKRYMD